MLNLRFLLVYVIVLWLYCQADRVNTLEEEALTEEAQLTEIRTELDDLNIKLADLKIIISATELTFNDTNVRVR